MAEETILIAALEKKNMDGFIPKEGHKYDFGYVIDELFQSNQTDLTAQKIEYLHKKMDLPLQLLNYFSIDIMNNSNDKTEIVKYLIDHQMVFDITWMSQALLIDLTDCIDLLKSHCQFNYEEVWKKYAESHHSCDNDAFIRVRRTLDPDYESDSDDGDDDTDDDEDYIRLENPHVTNQFDLKFHSHDVIANVEGSVLCWPDPFRDRIVKFNVERMVEAWESHDLKTLCDMYAEKCRAFEKQNTHIEHMIDEIPTIRENQNLKASRKWDQIADIKDDIQKIEKPELIEILYKIAALYFCISKPKANVV